VWPLEAFYVHDDTMAVVDTLTVEIKVTQPRELADYTRAFAGLAEMAVYGDAARASSRPRSTPWSEARQCRGFFQVRSSVPRDGKGCIAHHGRPGHSREDRPPGRPPASGLMPAPRPVARRSKCYATGSWRTPDWDR
jgi:hypothetical protein